MDIHFNKNLIKEAERLMKSEDICGEIIDLKRISYAIDNINGWNGKINAAKLDRELREKYPEIEVMLKTAENMIITNQNYQNTNIHDFNKTIELERLKQDYYAIMAKLLLASHKINKIEDFIDYVG